MSATWWATIILGVISIVAILASSYSSYRDRQQQLRIQRHREDPSYPLEAPPGAIRLYLRENWETIIAINICCAVFWYEVLRPGPITRGQIGVLVLVGAALPFTYVVGEFHRIYKTLMLYDAHIWRALAHTDKELRKMKDED